MKEKKKLSLATKTFIGFGLGIVIGLVFGEKARLTGVVKKAQLAETINSID